MTDGYDYGFHICEELLCQRKKDSLQNRRMCVFLWILFSLNVANGFLLSVNISTHYVPFECSQTVSYDAT